MHSINCVLVLKGRSDHMREYKFRGKREDANMWVYGYVFKTRKSNPCFDETTWIFNEEGKFKVESKTVGQYITIDDKNELEIYESDIVQFIAFDRIVIGIVEWDDDDGLPGFVIVDSDGSGTIWDFMYDDLTKIGNIYDNLGLLELHT